MNQYLKLQTHHDLDAIISLYGESVDSYQKGYLSKDLIDGAKLDYFFKWPNRAYQRLGAFRSHLISSRVNVSFDYNSDVSKEGSSRRGRASCKLELQKTVDEL